MFQPGFLLAVSSSVSVLISVTLQARSEFRVPFFLPYISSVRRCPPAPRVPHSLFFHGSLLSPLVC